VPLTASRLGVGVVRRPAVAYVVGGASCLVLPVWRTRPVDNNY
jgi:hypothetical protein